MNFPRVTIIATQRERFSLTQVSLESLLADYSAYPFQLIYVDGNSPPDIKQYLQKQAEQLDFMTVIRRETYLRSNTARNIALPLVKDADYIVYVDNDDIFEPGWLKRLVVCAEEENAALVTPLILQGQPHVDDIEVHVAGIETTFRPQRFNRQWFEQKQLLYGTPLKQVEAQLKRTETDSVEFHCILIRASVMASVELDEIFDSLASHTDLCMQVKVLGGKIFLEPSSRIVFLNPRQITGFTAEDVPFYRFKWSEPSIRAVFRQTARKWRIAKNDPSIWAIWRWVIENRQLPARAAIQPNSRLDMMLDFCQRKSCPGWLRTALESVVLGLTFPTSGIPSNLEMKPSHVEQHQLSTISEDEATSTAHQPLAV